MAKKRVVKEGIPIDTWEDADMALCEIATMKAVIDERTAHYNEEEQQQRAVLTAELQPLQEKVSKYEIGLQEFAVSHRDEFLKQKKSMKLNHGTLSFRISPPSLKTIKGVTWDAALGFIRAVKSMREYIRTKEEIKKDEILAAVSAQMLDEKDLLTVGLRVDQSEEFYYETHLAV
jgi:phage host-nuclease inhibitor protein Gam